METVDVLFEEREGAEGSLGIITLNRPAALNSLNHTMILAMYAQLQTWATASHIKAVVIKAAEGRAFCAGGDVRAAYQLMQAKDPAAALFFKDEYDLNRFIFHYPKPYIAFMDGITMGGGAGVSIHGSHRIATERLVFAMPETGIGFFPDVGGTYFLPRLPGALGYYLGLTGARIDSDDCMALGVTDLKIKRDSIAELITVLSEERFTQDVYQSVTNILQRFATATSPSLLSTQQDVIDSCFSASSVESILHLLQHSKNPICQDAMQMMRRKSPLSLKVTLQAFLNAKHLDFNACMHQEYRLTSRFLQGHDFSEGIRAVLIDKDQSPHWVPHKLEDISEKDVQAYFAPLSD